MHKVVLLVDTNPLLTIKLLHKLTVLYTSNVLHSVTLLSATNWLLKLTIPLNVALLSIVMFLIFTLLVNIADPYTLRLLSRKVVL